MGNESSVNKEELDRKKLEFPQHFFSGISDNSRFWSVSVLTRFNRTKIRLHYPITFFAITAWEPEIIIAKIFLAKSGVNCTHFLQHIMGQDKWEIGIYAFIGCKLHFSLQNWGVNVNWGIQEGNKYFLLRANISLPPPHTT